MRRSQEVSRYAAESRRRSEALARAGVGRGRVLAEFIYKRGDARAAVQVKTERNWTREVLPRTTTTLVVLKASAYHTHRGEVPETETEQLSNKRLQSEGWQDCRTFVFDAVQFSVQSSETAKPDADGYTAWMVLLVMKGLTAFSERRW